MIELAAQADAPIWRRYSSVVRIMTHRMARRAVERQLRDQGVRLTTFPCAQLRELTSAYIEAHPELLDEATKIVQGNPKLRKMAEIEERNRERRERKWREQQGKWGLLDHITPDPHS